MDIIYQCAGLLCAVQSDYIYQNSLSKNKFLQFIFIPILL